MHSIGSRCDFLLQKDTTSTLQSQILLTTLGLTDTCDQRTAVCCSSVVTCSDPPHSVHFLIPELGTTVASSSGQLLHPSPCQHNQEPCPHCPPHIAWVGGALRLYYCTMFRQQFSKASFNKEEAAFFEYCNPKESHSSGFPCARTTTDCNILQSSRHLMCAPS